MAAPYGDGRFSIEPPPYGGIRLNITNYFHIVEGKAEDPDIGSAVDSQYPNVAIITFDQPNQFGGMWAKEKLDLTMPFHTEMYLHLGHRYNNPTTTPAADGMTFTLHNDRAGLNAIAGAGEGLGVYKGRKWTGIGALTKPHGTHLRNALAIEFDTYRNTGQDSFVVDPGARNTSHVSVIQPQSDRIYVTDHRETRYFETSQQWILFKATWTPDDQGGGMLDYVFGNVQRSYRVGSIIKIFGGTKVYWGFTGSTGQYTAVQAAALVIMPKQGVIAEKKVANDDGEDIDQRVAFPGDTIHYTIKVTANYLGSPIGSVVIKDELSEFVEYAGGNVQVTTSASETFDVTPEISENFMSINTGRSLSGEGDWLEITFSVRVKNTAGGETVYNQAVITAAGLTGSQETNTTEVAIFEDPKKTVSRESEAGQNGGAVRVGDKITYNISYGNNDTVAGTVTITDRLADGLDFETASEGGKYNPITNTVTWTFENVPAGQGGVVWMVVSVNETAVVVVENSAMVRIGGHSPRSTNTVVNPVIPAGPMKVVSPGSEAGQGGEAVKTGDRVTYDIIYLNHLQTPATVVITDKLDDGVAFISATNGGVYDESTRTVTWTVENVPSGVTGFVSMVVQVSGSAVVKIENYATVEVDDEGPLNTNNVVNPVTPESPEKMVSSSSNAGQGGAAVNAGHRITYDITYLNYKETAATVVITDKLDNGVDFVSAANGGEYDQSTHTVTWILTDVPSGARGVVSLAVQVNASAVEKIENYATVQIDGAPLTTNTVVNPIIPFRCPKISRACRKTIAGCKIWVDNNNASGTRPPSVEIVLLRDGEVYRRKTIDSTGDGNYIFSCLPVWKNSEERYSYKVDELEVPDRYVKTIEGYDVINTLTMSDN